MRSINNALNAGPVTYAPTARQAGGPRGVAPNPLDNRNDVAAPWQPDQISSAMARDSEIPSVAGRFVSGVLVGTGAPQNIAHGFGVVPVDVLVAPYDTTPATIGEYTASEGAHDATNVVVTVTAGKSFKVAAWA